MTHVTDGTDEVRAFVAVLLGDAVRRPLVALLTRASALPCDVKWVEVANLHVTVKFLGNVASTALPAIGQALTEVARVTCPFEVTVAGLGTFPPRGVPRVVWVGLTANRAEALSSFASSVDAALSSIGYPREDRPFAAHVTIGRVRSPRGQADLKAFIENESAFRAGRQSVPEVALMRSDLCPNGPVYTKLAAFSLGGRAAGEGRGSNR